MTNELSPLLKELQSDDPRVRKSAMERLGNLGTDAAIRALIGVANGRRGAFLGLFGYHHGVEDQLAAVQVLGQTQSSEAREYLQRLVEYSKHECGGGYYPAEIYGSTRSTDGWVHSDTYLTYSFAGIRGELGTTINSQTGKARLTPALMGDKLTQAYPDGLTLLPNTREGNIIRQAVERHRARAAT